MVFVVAAHCFWFPYGRTGEVAWTHARGQLSQPGGSGLQGMIGHRLARSQARAPAELQDGGNPAETGTCRHQEKWRRFRLFTIRLPPSSFR